MGGLPGRAVTRLGRTLLQGSWQSRRPQGTELVAPRGRSQAGPCSTDDSLSGGHSTAGLRQPLITYRGPQRGCEPTASTTLRQGNVWAGTRAKSAEGGLAALRACESASLRCQLPSQSSVEATPSQPKYQQGQDPREKPEKPGDAEPSTEAQSGSRHQPPPESWEAAAAETWQARRTPARHLGLHIPK